MIVGLIAFARETASCAVSQQWSLMSGSRCEQAFERETDEALIIHQQHCYRRFASASVHLRFFDSCFGFGMSKTAAVQNE